MNRDELLIAQLEDRADRASDRYMLVAGDFLDTHQRKVAEDFAKSRKLPVRLLFYGGYEDAERSMPVFLPDYIEMPEKGVPEEVSDLLRIVRVSVSKGGRQLSHRDYLGSLLALGLDREVTGDILVRKPDERTGGGADIIVQTEIADFIEMNYNKAGRTSLTVEVLPIDSLDTGSINIEQKQDTVASLRLDSICASAFGLSRAKAAEAIRRGIVSVNSVEATKIDMEIREKDKIVMRGKGKVTLDEIGGTSRKDRIRIKLNLYR
ncbi:MAG: YlmH/Sll1252 family protein [Clostridia bacterium]|nr:YlmH/Sll1252 family protein [Clostridia bacterium]